MQIKQMIDKIHNCIKQKKVISIVVVILIIAIATTFYGNKIVNAVNKNQFAKEITTISEKNKNPMFGIEKVSIYSNADAVDSSQEQNLQDVNISQYTDIAIYINNKVSIKELTQENTISKLSIDNIKIESNSLVGEKTLNYKNPRNFSEFKLPERTNSRNETINFSIVHTNEENRTADYDLPTFFTDCSNPITLSYLNKDIVTHYKVTGEKNVISFNGKMLKEAKVNLSDLNYTISFSINITNNLGEEFVYEEKFDVKLDNENGGLYNGYLYMERNSEDKNYYFFKK